jgi:hypothetical protein
MILLEKMAAILEKMIQDRYCDFAAAYVVKDFLQPLKHSSLDKESAELTSLCLSFSHQDYLFEDLR